MVNLVQRRLWQQPSVSKTPEVRNIRSTRQVTIGILTRIRVYSVFKGVLVSLGTGSPVPTARDAASAVQLVLRPGTARRRFRAPQTLP